jgi:hypothetical protein
MFQTGGLPTSWSLFLRNTPDENRDRNKRFEARTGGQELNLPRYPAASQRISPEEGVTPH